MARDLGRIADVQRIAPAALASSVGMARRHVLCNRSSVQEFEDRFRSTVAAVDTRA